jgi:hypothetical protein
MDAKMTRECNNKIRRGVSAAFWYIPIHWRYLGMDLYATVFTVAIDSIPWTNNGIQLLK